MIKEEKLNKLRNLRHSLIEYLFETIDDNKHIKEYFDKYLFPVPYDKLEEYILLVMKKLGKEQGYDFNDLKIEFKENDNGETIAYFLHAGDKPIGFCFYLNKFDHTSPNKIKDTCGHEFGNFVVCLENPGNQPENAHGTKWMDVCKRNGVVPSAHMHNGLTKHIK